MLLLFSRHRIERTLFGNTFPRLEVFKDITFKVLCCKNFYIYFGLIKNYFALNDKHLSIGSLVMSQLSDGGTGCGERNLELR